MKARAAAKKEIGATVQSCKRVDAELALGCRGKGRGVELARPGPAVRQQAAEHAEPPQLPRARFESAVWQLHCDPCRERGGGPGVYFFARREARHFRSEGEAKGAKIPCLHYYHHLVPDQQFSYDSFARLDLVFNTQHKVGEVLRDECRKGAIDLP